MIAFQKFGRTYKGRPTLVFLHGWGGKWQSWFPLIERLKAHYKTYALDLPGFGESMIPKPYLLQDYANDVVAFIEKEKIKNPVIVGHSLGGAIALKIALERPEIALGLILISSAGVRGKLDTKARFLQVIAKAGKSVFHLPILNRFSHGARKRLYTVAGREDADYYQIHNDVLKQTFSNVVREDLTNQFRHIKNPTLILWGGKDVSTPLKDGETTHRGIPGSQMIVFPYAGHFVYLEETEKCAVAITHFLQTITCQ